MKSILFITLFSLSFCTYSQNCLLTLDELHKIRGLDEVDLETFALVNGFYFDTQQKLYVCEDRYSEEAEGLQNEPLSMFNKIEDEVLFAFFDKEHYLEIKKSIPKENFTKTELDEELGKAFYYRFADYIVILSTKTVKAQNAYYVNIVNSLDQ